MFKSKHKYKNKNQSPQQRCERIAKERAEKRQWIKFKNFYNRKRTRFGVEGDCPRAWWYLPSNMNGKYYKGFMKPRKGKKVRRKTWGHPGVICNKKLGEKRTFLMGNWRK